MKFVLVAMTATLALTGVATPSMAQNRDPAEVAKQRMKRLDTDSSGTVSLEEFTAARKEYAEKNGGKPEALAPKRLKSDFDKMDANKDGSITLDEVEKDQASKAG